jgi:hypothetical protein
LAGIDDVTLAVLAAGAAKATGDQLALISAMPMADASVVTRNEFPISNDLHMRMRKRALPHDGSAIYRQARIRPEVQCDLRCGL